MVGLYRVLKLINRTLLLKKTIFIRLRFSSSSLRSFYRKLILRVSILQYRLRGWIILFEVHTHNFRVYVISGYEDNANLFAFIGNLFFESRVWYDTCTCAEPIIKIGKIEDHLVKSYQNFKRKKKKSSFIYKRVYFRTKLW